MSDIFKDIQAERARQNVILSDAVSCFGVEMQTIKAMEELAELTQALSKTLLGYQNGDNLREEIADVEIMLSQLRMMYDVENSDGSVDDMKEYKLERLRNTIETKRARIKECAINVE